MNWLYFFPKQTSSFHFKRFELSPEIWGKKMTVKRKKKSLSASSKQSRASNPSPSFKGKKLVVVESPTKAKTIRRFLGRDFMVESCMGHIRDLPQSSREIPPSIKKESWSSLGVNVDDGFKPVYCIPKNKTKVVSLLREKLKEVSQLYLATDEDREGESISWHLVEVLKPKIPVKRMVFHEITQRAINHSLEEVRDLKMDLVRAQEARRVLDRLVGYSLSPILWKKIAYGLSAGRVQSVALRLTTQREQERMLFQSSFYFSLLAKVQKKGEAVFQVRMLSWKGKKIAVSKDFDSMTGKFLSEGKAILLQDSQAKEIKEKLSAYTEWKVQEVEKKTVYRYPSPPFITSTLQQDANRKLGLSSRDTMRIAQKLYEQGLITYMRTDSVQLSTQAVEQMRQYIDKNYGPNFLPDKRPSYKGKQSKGAQEAHEAIRPAGEQLLSPSDSGLSAQELKIYDLIWKRSLASQMAPSRQKRMQVKVHAGEAIFTASGTTIEFLGFLKVYKEGTEEGQEEDVWNEQKLPPLKKGDSLQLHSIEAKEHETKAPPRYSEASLIQKMEKEGIGRPSTYSSIIGTITDRGYVQKVQKALVPTFTAFAVSKLLQKYFPQYVDLNFTSEMEASLDVIAGGELNWKVYLNSIYFGKKGLKTQVEVESVKIQPEEARVIALQNLKSFDFRVGRYGAYVCTQYKGKEVRATIPQGLYPGEINKEKVLQLIKNKVHGHDSLGKEPQSQLPVYLLNGQYGMYVQLGDVDKEAKNKPKRVSLPSAWQDEKVDLKKALFLLSLPKVLGAHSQTGKEVKIGIGRFGPYVVHEGDYRSVPKEKNLMEVDLAFALELLAKPKRGRGKTKKVLKDMGEDSKGKTVQVLDGPYGPYIKYGTKNISLPEGTSIETFTLQEALKIIQNQPAKISRKKKAPSSFSKGIASPQAEKAKINQTPKVIRRRNKTDQRTT